jgi:predicted O-methyltransferase YrrM
MNLVLIIFFSTLIAIIAFLIVKVNHYRNKVYRLTGKNNNQTTLIPTVKLDEFHSAFRSGDYGTTNDAEVSIILRGDSQVDGGTTDLEAWILSVLARYSKSMFEFGTCTGRTTYHLGRNSSDDAKIVTLTLHPDQVSSYIHSGRDNETAHEVAINESNYTKFFYSGTDIEHKITQLFMDSKDLDETQYPEMYDLIFIDGSHAYSYIKSDTEKALKMLKNGGIILWHDYNENIPEIRDVYKYLNELRQNLNIVHLHGTNLVAYKNTGYTSHA